MDCQPRSHRSWDYLVERINFPGDLQYPLFEKIGETVLSGKMSPLDLEAGKVTVPRIKIIADGSIQGFTGYLSEPYHVPFKGDDTYRGYASVPRDILFQ